MNLQLTVRLPADAKAFVEAEARENASSQNSEIVRAIRAAMKAKGPASVAALPSHRSSNPSTGKANEHLNHNTATPYQAIEMTPARIANEIDAAGDFLDAIYMAAQALNGEEVTAIQRLAATALRHIEEAQKEIGLYTARAAR